MLGQTSRCSKPGQGFTLLLKHLKRGKNPATGGKSPLPVPISLELNFTWLWNSPAEPSSGKHESPRAAAQEVRLHCTKHRRSAPQLARRALVLQSHFSHQLKSKFRKGREKKQPLLGAAKRGPLARDQSFVLRPPAACQRDVAGGCCGTLTAPAQARGTSPAPCEVGNPCAASNRPLP